MFENVHVRLQARGAATPYQWGRPLSRKLVNVYVARVPGIAQHKRVLKAVPLVSGHWAAVALV
jgi:hypothetical protein